MSIRILAMTAVMLASPALAQDAASGDAAAGEKVFNKCKACHMIEGPDGAVVKGGKVGPNLYGVVGRQAGTYEDFKYSDLMIEAGKKGLNWNEDDFKVYVKDATAFLRDYTGESSGRGKMTFKLKDDADAADVWAYLASVGPAASN